MTLTSGLADLVVQRARLEASAGAPADMIAVYVDIELRHGLAGHPGESGHCDHCHNHIFEPHQADLAEVG